MRIFLWLSFDGTAYHGWQIQPNGMSVQEKVQQCLSTLLSQPIAVTGAGRTDAGVHARTMVCHFDIDKELDTDQLCYRLNRILPRDISCGRAEHVSDEMHARFSAKRRTYRYFIHTQRDPFLRHYSVETHWKLDFEMMNEAALWLTTQDDFKAFCKAGADNKTTLCQVTTAQWVSTSPTTWYFEIARYSLRCRRVDACSRFVSLGHRILNPSLSQRSTCCRYTGTPCQAAPKPGRAP